MDVEYDIFEQRHFEKSGKNFEDNVMYLKADIDIDSVALVKLLKIDESKKKVLSQSVDVFNVNSGSNSSKS